MLPTQESAERCKVPVMSGSGSRGLYLNPSQNPAVGSVDEKSYLLLWWTARGQQPRSTGIHAHAVASSALTAEGSPQRPGARPTAFSVASWWPGDAGGQRLTLRWPSI